LHTVFQIWCPVKTPTKVETSTGIRSNRPQAAGQNTHRPSSTDIDWKFPLDGQYRFVNLIKWVWICAWLPDL